MDIKTDQSMKTHWFCVWCLLWISVNANEVLCLMVSLRLTLSLSLCVSGFSWCLRRWCPVNGVCWPSEESRVRAISAVSVMRREHACQTASLSAAATQNRPQTRFLWKQIKEQSPNTAIPQSSMLSCELRWLQTLITLHKAKRTSVCVCVCVDLFERESLWPFGSCLFLFCFFLPFQLMSLWGGCVG